MKSGRYFEKKSEASGIDDVMKRGKIKKHERTFVVS